MSDKKFILFVLPDMKEKPGIADVTANFAYDPSTVGLAAESDYFFLAAFSARFNAWEDAT